MFFGQLKQFDFASPGLLCSDIWMIYGITGLLNISELLFVLPPLLHHHRCVQSTYNISELLFVRQIGGD